MRALVVGGAGFVGSQVVDELVGHGWEVRVLDRLDPRVHVREAPVLPAGVEFLRGDVRSPEDRRAALEPAVDVVVHCAALVGLGRGALDAAEFLGTNVIATADLLQDLARHPRPPERVVLTSSMATYGEGTYACPRCGPGRALPRRAAELERGRWEVSCPKCTEPMAPQPTSEDLASEPLTMYARSKLLQEQVAMEAGRALHLPVVALRLHNVYGPRMPRGTPYSGVAALLKSALLDGRRPPVYEDGLQRRDFVHVADVARAHRAAAEVPLDVAAFEAFNIGTGEPRTILELAESLADRLAPHLRPEVTGTFRLGDVRHIYASIDKARRVLGYQPRVDFPTGMAAFAREGMRGVAEAVVA